MTEGVKLPEAPSPAAAQAANVLRQVFGRLAAPFAFRLWDGTVVAIGNGAPAFTVVFGTRETFARLMRNPTPYAFAEAYVESALDIEGDLFAAMQVSETLEALRLPLRERLRLGWRMRSALKSTSSSTRH